MPDLASGAAKTDIPGRFLVAINGKAVAWTDPHGSAMEWIAGEK